MTIKNLFIITAIVCLLFALSLAFIPQMLSDFYNTDPSMSSGAILLARAYGSILLGLGIALWIARDALPSLGRRGLLISITVTCACLAVNYIYAIVAGIINNQGWGLIILSTVLAAWGGMLLTKETGKEA